MQLVGRQIYITQFINVFLIHNVFADKSSVLTNGLIKYLEPKEAYYGIKHKNKDIRNIDNAEVFHNPKSI